MLNITSGGMSGGYKTYLSNLVPRLASHPEVNQLLVSVTRGCDCGNGQRSNDAVEWLRMQRRSLPMSSEVAQGERRVIERFAPDVVFIPTSRYWSLGSIPVVNMVRNMMPMTPNNSKYCIERLRNWARFVQMRRAVTRSDRVLAISQFVKDYLTGELGIAEDRVGVVYHGAQVDDVAPVQPGGLPESCRNRFVFTAGLIYPYRGIEDLIEAWCYLRGLPDLPSLVIAGKVGQGMSRYYAKLLRLVRERNLDTHVHFIGVLNRSEMAWCYRYCSAFVMTSRVEACPNIALEAMVSGAPCISTRNPPLPEVFAEAASYYPAGESTVLAERIHDILQLSDSRREAIRACAIARAARFSWDACCRRTVEELQKAIG